MSALLARVSGWVYGAVLLLVLASAGMLYQRAAGDAQGKAAVQRLWEADKAARAAAESKAVAQRVAANAALAAQQVATSAAITKAHDEEINDVRARLAAERMRRPAFCASPGPTPSADAGGSASGAAADPAGGLLPDAVARDIQALILQTEEVAAVARACQTFVRQNGMTQPYSNR